MAKLDFAKTKRNKIVKFFELQLKKIHDCNYNKKLLVKFVLNTKIKVKNKSGPTCKHTFTFICVFVQDSFSGYDITVPLKKMLQT